MRQFYRKDHNFGGPVDLEFKAYVYENKSSIVGKWSPPRLYAVITMGNDWLGQFDAEDEAERVALQHNLESAFHRYADYDEIMDIALTG